MAEEAKPYYLTEYDRQFLALGLHGVAMRQGPTVFDIVERIAKKIDALGFVKDFAQDWIAYSDKKEDEKCQSRD